MSREVPEEWRTVDLGDVAKESRARNSELSISEERLVGVFKDQGMLPMRDRVRGTSVERCKVVRPGDFAYNPMRINIGSIARSTANANLMVSPDYVVFSPDTNKIDGLFLDYLRKSDAWAAFVGNAGDGGVRIRIYFEHLARFRFNLPPLHEQRRIVEILCSVDEAIAATRSVIEQTRKVKQGVLERLLTKGIGHARSKPTEIGEIPEAWSLKCIHDIANVKAGATPSRALHDRYFVGGNIPWVKTGDLSDGVVAETEEMITEAAVAESSCEVHPAGTVLVAMYGGFQQIGRSGILTQPAATNQAISALRLRDESVLGLYLNLALVGLRQKWRTVAASSRKDPNITKDDVLRFKVPVPPLAEQQQIIELMTGVEDSQRVLEDELLRLRECRSALMSDLLTGRKRVTDALPMAAE